MSVLGALAAAAVVLVTAVLPAEYGIDPTGIGGALGFTELNSQPTRTLEIKDVLGGNETVREVEIPANEPVPLPNPAIHQAEDRPIQTRTVTLTLESSQQTEIKPCSARASHHLHVESRAASLRLPRPRSRGPGFFVRYREDQEGATEVTGSSSHRSTASTAGTGSTSTRCPSRSR
jgi:hypothetical protein